jgi:hypothetical protein
VRMILDLWARASSMWLLGEFGILLFCSPGFWGVGGGSFARAFLPGRLVNLFFKSQVTSQDSVKT